MKVIPKVCIRVPRISSQKNVVKEVESLHKYTGKTNIELYLKINTGLLGLKEEILARKDESRAKST